MFKLKVILFLWFVFIEILLLLNGIIFSLFFGIIIGYFFVLILLK